MVAARESDPSAIDTFDVEGLDALYDSIGYMRRAYARTVSVGVFFRENDNAIPLIDLMERGGIPLLDAQREENVLLELRREGRGSLHEARARFQRREVVQAHLLQARRRLPPQEDGR